jgi:magnesium-transporting ATPase (P-type)
VKYWPRVVFLCIFVYLCFAFWTFFPVAIALGLMVGAPSLSSIFFALLVLTVQVWITGRLFVNFLFWQQFAVLDNCDVGESLRRSKELGRSGRDLPWYRRPMWRGVFIASLWFAFVMACNWPFLRDYFRMVTTTTDPQALLEKMRKMSTNPPTNLSIALGYVQSILRPLLGIGFVLLYFDSKTDNE